LKKLRRPHDLRFPEPYSSVPIVRAASMMSASSSGQRVAHRQRGARAFLGRQHVVDERAAMQNALLLASERVDVDERRGVRRRRADRGGRGAVGVRAVAGRTGR
jgi:hypothetical protein